ncbi:Stf0 family sulfotransferase [Afifella pfennigii]|uniref:Stf0 family sulfotransferase n=1 Tax=Afifella pfennigii TaxID=209897 RepID=UPI000478E0A2|nr:Stf0 family sulfotransferase [Afifella pfennigii]
MAEALTPKSLLRAVKKLRLLERLAERGDAGLLADAAMEDFLKTYRDGAFASLLLASDAPCSERAHLAHIWSISVVDEARLKRYAAHQFPGATVKGFIADAALMAAARTDPFQEEAEILTLPEPKSLYAVLCGPRSGSTWFCNLIRGTGLLGEPREHLRPFILFLSEHRRAFGLNLQRWLALLIRKETQNGIFGTKIIQDFALELMPSLTSGEREAVERLARRARFVDFRRRDQVAQAVSEYLAEATRIWHVRTPEHLPDYEAAKVVVPYDRQCIAAAFARHRAAEARTEAWLESSGRPAVRLFYEDVLADPRAALEEVHLFLTGEAAPAFELATTRYQRLGDEVNEAMVERFRKEEGL